ncbi:hypothetical protein RFI_09026 [Reticulomyxa filosa]|uniref:Uncharacterized protein n=1 Tax=Reticulomyxa filosa TaxID=46433 RepID=X6NQ07_RETFI|nr:hypothetical protein RFI_09026 [Reticulomyxa filosa]|eukprot:ETO28106.1 hypothetical protein RFI_09026 [Reticulomyxa filosa]
MVQVGYISMDWVNTNPLYMYAAIGAGSAGVMLLIFMLLFLWEVKTYGIYKYIDRDDEKARNHYFYSFVGTIIYGHGQFKSSNNKVSMIMRLLCDTLFLVICDKLVMILCCTGDGKWRVDSKVTCWEGEHLKIGSIALIALAYYIPFCIMVAPMFVEFSTPLSGSCKDYFSLTSTVEFIKPYLSFITLSKSFMLVSAQFISQGKPVGTVLSQLLVCLALFASTVLWSWKNFNPLEFQQVSTPAFPYGVSIVKSLAFFAGVIGSIIELLFVYEVLPNTLFGASASQQDTDMQYLLLLVMISCVIAGLCFLRLKHVAKRAQKQYAPEKQAMLEENVEIQDMSPLFQGTQIAFDIFSNRWSWS